jgi:hypothetical protein
MAQELQFQSLCGGCLHVFRAELVKDRIVINMKFRLLIERSGTCGL